ncbi:MAG TPA: MTH938/NDUFAF3 family protein [Vicinamibacterales bacterium]|nr:MTH938/NDUFAF3 family protein [Vicinamibacterales bacterium]
MNISGYRFGKVDIGGKTYTSDVIITPERVIDGWWRQQGHALAVADLDDVVAAKPDVLVIGTGYFGGMSVSRETRRYLEAQGIQVRDARTGEAAHDFNELQKEHGRVVAALHLTC